MKYGEYVVWDEQIVNMVIKKTKKDIQGLVLILETTYENYLKHEEVVLRENKVSVTVGVRMLLGEYYQKV